jgi:hypothetical protein
VVKSLCLRGEDEAVQIGCAVSSHAGSVPYRALVVKGLS